MDKFKRGYLYARAMHSSVYCNMVSLACFQEAEIFMARFLHHLNFHPSRRIFCHILALCWAAGLGCGIFCWFLVDASLFSLMRSALHGSVSIVSLLSVTALPFFLSAFVVFLSCHGLLFVISFGKGILFAFVSMGTLACFGCAGWLVQLLLCFSDLLSLPLLYWYWLRSFRVSGNSIHSTELLTAALLFLIGSIDYCLIAPFLADLIII